MCKDKKLELVILPPSTTETPDKEEIVETLVKFLRLFEPEY